MRDKSDAYVRVTREGIEGQATWSRGFGDVFSRWTAAPGRLTLETCHTGFVPCFYYSDATQIIASTTIEAFRDRIPLRLDRDALSLFGRLGFYLGDDTPFAGISVVGPRTTLTWSDGTVTTEERPFPVHAFEGAYEDALRLYVEMFTASVARIAETASDNFIITLTGGRDSRHIAIELARLGLKPRFVLTTRLFPTRPDLDWPIARQLCDRYGWEHRVVSPPDDWYAMDRWCVASSSLMTHEHGWLQGVAEEIAREEVEFVYDGVGGDVLSAGLYQSCETPAKVLGKWNGGGVGILTLPDFGDILGSEAEAERRIAVHFRDAKTFHFWNRTRRSTALLPFRMTSAMGLAPYVSPEMVRFFLSLPLQFTADGQFHNRAIALAAPDLDVPYADESHRLPKLPLLPPRAYAARLLRSDGRYKKQYLKAILRGWPSIAGYLPRGLIYMDELERWSGQPIGRASRQN